MQHKVSAIMIGRAVYAVVLALSLIVIFLLQPSSTVAANDIFYYALLAVAFADLVMMLYMDRVFARALQSRSAEGPAPNLPVGPIVLAALAASMAIYGILYHLIGGSQIRSLSFVLISVLGYILFSILAVKYDSLPGDNSGQ